MGLALKPWIRFKASPIVWNVAKVMFAGWLQHRGNDEENKQIIRQTRYFFEPHIPLPSLE